MRFRLLGPVEVDAGGATIRLGPPKQRAVLAALLVDAGRPVLIDTLIDRVWPEAPPPAVRNALYSHIARIRAVLAQHNGNDRPTRVTRRSGGYAIDVDPAMVDLLRFRALSEAARLTGAPPADRVRTLDEALALWRGDPLADVAGAWAERVRDALTEDRIATVLLWARLATELGQHDRVIAETARVLARHPLVEPLVAAQMQALVGADRTAEALSCFAGARQRLLDELGTEPGVVLQRLHSSILRGGTAVTGTDTTPRPAQLPVDVPAFAGRLDALALLDPLVADRGRQTPSVTVATITGTAGVGKTTLAVHWAHNVRHHFADGQLYVNLGGFAPGASALDPADALAGFLEALGVPGSQQPTEAHAREGLYRTLLADRRMLVVLDNARDCEQVRPLLPGARGCLAVVTSRSQLAGLVAQGAYPVPLDVLTPAEAQELLTRRLGGARVAAEPAAVEEIVASCAALPLALVIVAARAALAPSARLAALAADLHGTAGELDGLSGTDPATNVRAVLSWSYEALGVNARRMFRLLSLCPGAGMSVAAAASFTGLPTAATRSLLAELANVHMIIDQGDGRHSCHDLLRAYATELAQTLDRPAHRRAALRRGLDHYLATAHAAVAFLEPSVAMSPPEPPPRGVTPQLVTDHREAWAWLGTERLTLIAAIRRAADARFDAHVYHLAERLRTPSPRGRPRALSTAPEN